MVMMMGKGLSKDEGATKDILRSPLTNTVSTSCSQPHDPRAQQVLGAEFRIHPKVTTLNLLHPGGQKCAHGRCGGPGMVTTKGLMRFKQTHDVRINVSS